MITTIKPFEHHGKQFIPLSSDTIRYIFPVITKSEWCLLTFMIYKIEAFGKDSDFIPYSQFRHYTPVHSNEAISKALKGLEKIGLIKRERQSVKSVTSYALNLDAEITRVVNDDGLTGLMFKNGEFRPLNFGFRTSETEGINKDIYNK